MIKTSGRPQKTKIDNLTRSEETQFSLPRYLRRYSRGNKPCEEPKKVKEIDIQTSFYAKKTSRVF